MRLIGSRREHSDPLSYDQEQFGSEAAVERGFRLVRPHFGNVGHITEEKGRAFSAAASRLGLLDDSNLRADAQWHLL